MKKKILIVTILIILILVAIVTVILTNKKEEPYIIGFDNENKYIVTTNTKWISMRNDGGSHTNIYYEIDFNENSIIKCEDKYVGFKGYEYKGKIIDSKKINDSQKNKLKSILNDAIKNNIDKEDSMNFDFYIISSCNNEDIKIYDEDDINRIKNMLDNN